MFRFKSLVSVAERLSKEASFIPGAVIKNGVVKKLMKTSLMQIAEYYASYDIAFLFPFFEICRL